MSGHRTAVNVTIAAATAGVFALLVGSSPSVSAQNQSWTPPYRLLLTPERAMALADAASQRLDYVPGEVLVKFNPGVNAVGQERALAALRSRPNSNGLRWVGDVAVWTDPFERDSTILAAQLRAQPEVAYAEPNYLYRAHTTPNDPGFAPRQWNFAALDMPRVWDINPGGKDSVTVAVVDTGITSVAQSFFLPTWNGSAVQNVLVPFALNPDLAAARHPGTAGRGLGDVDLYRSRRLEPGTA